MTMTLLDLQSPDIVADYAVLPTTPYDAESDALINCKWTPNTTPDSPKPPPEDDLCTDCAPLTPPHTSISSPFWTKQLTFEVESQTDATAVVTGKNTTENEYAAALKQVLPTGYFQQVMNTFAGKTFRIGKSTFLVHSGLPDTLDIIDLDFGEMYVGKPLHMIGYLYEIGSDDFIMLDKNGKVYRAEDSILYVVGDDVESYFVNGPEDFGYYDYYDHLDHKKGIPCAGGSHREEMQYWKENQDSLDKLSEKMEEINTSSVAPREIGEYKSKTDHYVELVSCN